MPSFGFAQRSCHCRYCKEGLAAGDLRVSIMDLSSARYPIEAHHHWTCYLKYGKIKDLSKFVGFDRLPAETRVEVEEFVEALEDEKAEKRAAAKEVANAAKRAIKDAEKAVKDAAKVAAKSAKAAVKDAEKAAKKAAKVAAKDAEKAVKGEAKVAAKSAKAECPALVGAGCMGAASDKSFAAEASGPDPADTPLAGTKRSRELAH